MADLDDIRGRLDALSEELADLALERLRESVEAGGGAAASEERRITRARRAVERAAAILAGAGGTVTTDDPDPRGYDSGRE